MLYNALPTSIEYRSFRIKDQLLLVPNGHSVCKINGQPRILQPGCSVTILATDYLHFFAEIHATLNGFHCKWMLLIARWFIAVCFSSNFTVWEWYTSESHLARLVPHLLVVAKWGNLTSLLLSPKTKKRGLGIDCLLNRNLMGGVN